MKDDQLISAAEGILRPRVVKGRIFGDVGAAILSTSDRLFVGISVDTPSWGLCAERCALASMIAAGEYAFRKAVAVWRDPASHLLHVLPPCGVCREFIRSIDEGNLSSEIILGRGRIIRPRTCFLRMTGRSQCITRIIDEKTTSKYQCHEHFC